MARPTVITDEQILKAARDVFLAKGISATTAEVAKRAGCAEGSLFKRFRTKADLFKAAMHLEDPAFLRGLSGRVGRGDVEQQLYEVGSEMLDFFRRLLPIVMMSWSNPSGDPLSHLRVPNPPPLRALKNLAAYFEAEMRLGRLQRHDPEILARMFLGSIQNYAFFEVLLKAHEELPLPAETFLRGVINLIWTGVAPKRRNRGRR